MVEPVLRIIGLITCFAAVIHWIVCLIRWDGKAKCDESQCDSCPFPCEKHEKESK